uniref:Carbonyl reductase [NADPH] 1-like n=1 Tax=Acanthochromis polyacanthus TaxID=80966 RepID=A0A3Q1FCM1_9TELE
MSVKVAVVTGSNKGIGLAIVRALCKQYQGDVYLTSRDVGRGEEAVKSLSSEGLNPKFHQLDINDLSSITAAAAFFKEKYGGVDILINNAAILFKEGDTTPFAVQAEVTLKTNFFATRDMLTHFLPLIKVRVETRTLVINKCSKLLKSKCAKFTETKEEPKKSQSSTCCQTKKH